MSGIPRRMAASMTAGSLALMSATSAAQGVTGPDASVDNFSRSRNTSVRQRARPDYEAPGIRAGSVLIYPRVEASVEGNDNIYAGTANRRSDAIWRVRPELAVESGWSQSSLSAYVRGSINRYADNGARTSTSTAPARRDASTWTADPASASERILRVGSNRGRRPARPGMQSNRQGCGRPRPISAGRGLQAISSCRRGRTGGRSTMKTVARAVAT